MKKLEKIGRIIYNYRVWSTLEWLKGEVEIYYNHHSERGGRWKTVPANMSGCLPEKEQVHWYICEENRNSRILWCLGAYKHDKSNQEGQERPKCGFPWPDQCIWINSPWSSLRIIQHLPHIRSNHNTENKICFIIRVTHNMPPSPKNFHQWCGKDPTSAELLQLLNTSWQDVRPASLKGNTTGDTTRSSRAWHRFWRASGAQTTSSHQEQIIPWRQQCLGREGQKTPEHPSTKSEAEHLFMAHD